MRHFALREEVDHHGDFPGHSYVEDRDDSSDDDRERRLRTQVRLCWRRLVRGEVASQRVKGFCWVGDSVPHRAIIVATTLVLIQGVAGG